MRRLKLLEIPCQLSSLCPWCWTNRTQEVAEVNSTKRSLLIKRILQGRFLQGHAHLPTETWKISLVNTLPYKLSNSDVRFFPDVIYDLSSPKSERSATVNQISVSELCAEMASQCQEIKVQISF